MTHNHDRVITHLEPDILECEVKWALGSITMNKASGGDRVPVELFQILKDDAVKVLHSIWQQIWKMQQWPQDWKRSVFILIPKKGKAKEFSNYHSIALISHASKAICVCVCVCVCVCIHICIVFPGDASSKEHACHFRILAWRIPRTKGPGKLQSIGLQRVWQYWSNLEYIRAGVGCHALLQGIFPTQGSNLCLLCCR